MTMQPTFFSLVLLLALHVTYIAGFGSFYLSSLSSISVEETKEEAETFLEKTTAPDEWYGKTNPMASWGGWKHAQYGGYLNNLSREVEEPDQKNTERTSTTSDYLHNLNNGQASFVKGKQSDYGDDVRWGTEVYLQNMNRK